MVAYIKNSFSLRYLQFESMAHINLLLEQWLLEVADQWFNGTAKVVALDGYIDIRGNRLSAPCHLCGMTVPIRLNLDGELRIFDHHEYMVTRNRLRDKGWPSISEHHARLWQQVYPVMTRDLQVYEEVGSWR